LLELRRITSHVGISTKTLSSSTIVSHSVPVVPYKLGTFAFQN
jgi:hypothetical protein